MLRRNFIGGGYMGQLLADSEIVCWSVVALGCRYAYLVEKCKLFRNQSPCYPLIA